MKEFTIIDNDTGIEIMYWVGTNAKDNWDIIDKSHQNDIWFHLSDQPSAHVILKVGQLNLKKISRQVLNECAVQCKSHSKFANISNRMKVLYTEIKNVTKGKTPGEVYTRKTNTIAV